MGRKTVGQELTKEIIMEAARTLFVQHGYKNVSMRKIAQRLKYSHGALYYHFKNKAELFYAIIEKDFEALDRMLACVMEKQLPSIDQMKEVLLVYIRFGLGNQNQYEMMFLLKDQEITQYLQERPLRSYDRFAQVLYELSGKSLDMQQTWSIFMALHGFVTHYSRFGLSFEQAEEAARRHVQTLMNWIMKNESRSTNDQV